LFDVGDFMKGLVLEGGGTKGAYQIGAYKALRDLGISFKGYQEHLLEH